MLPTVRHFQRMFAFISFLIPASFSVLTDAADEKSFLLWMRETNNFYTGDDYHLRFGIWLINKQFVQSHNKNSNSRFECTMNRFAALTPSEFRAFSALRSSLQGRDFHFMSNTHKFHQNSTPILPDLLDLREHNPPVLNQICDLGNCNGGDWAFAITCAAETNHALSRFLVLYKFSEQSLIDCIDGLEGCAGGDVYTGFAYIVNTAQFSGTIMQESDYPWTGTKGTCTFDVTKGIQAFSGVLWSREQPEEHLISYIYQYGAAAASMDGTRASFRLYSKGIYQDSACQQEINHAVNLVGYGTENDVPYYIARNCWGRSWGEDGYFRILRGQNMCGIALDVGFPVVF